MKLTSCNGWTIGTKQFCQQVLESVEQWKKCSQAVECQAGQATVNLQLQLDQHHSLQEHHVKHVTTSRLRRRARRAQARADAAVNAAADAAAAVDTAVQPTNPNTAFCPIFTRRS